MIQFFLIKYYIYIMKNEGRFVSICIDLYRLLSVTTERVYKKVSHNRPSWPKGFRVS
jgi:hypothetical protein